MVAKKDYFQNTQVGTINKVALNNFFVQSPTYEIKLTKINHATGEYEGTFKGKVKIMSYSKNFEDQVLEFMKEIKSDVKKIDSRLNTLEKDVKILKKDVNQIKSLPTIQNELKNE